MARVVGVDVGGTCTDFVMYDTVTGSLENWKNLTTPEDPLNGIRRGIERIPDAEGIERLRIGTTLATNTILTRSGARVAYVTTKGFRDVPFIQRINRKSHYDITWIKPKPLVRREHCFEIDERIGPDGSVIKPLDEKEVRALAESIKEKEEIEAIAVCTLFSYVDPSHENRVAEILQQEMPHIPVSTSYGVLPKWKEYERASTCIADAYLKPKIAGHLQRLGSEFGTVRGSSRVSVIKSNGGECTLKAAGDTPINLVLSGPTGAVVASRALSKVTGEENLVTFDMGGTSTDCSTVVNGLERLTTGFEIEWGVPVQVPVIDIHTIGAGGGSIAWIDKGGMLRVGPKSAGADPGPACYQRGGKEPTVTDANVVLGRINTEGFLGGAIQLSGESAWKSIQAIAEQLGMEVDETALAIVNIANNNMHDAIRGVLLGRGLDPRDFALVAGGGAGPVHAADILEMSDIRKCIIPNFPGQYSALGFIMTDARIDRHRTIQQTSTNFDLRRAERITTELSEDVLRELKQQGYEQNIELYRFCEIRYFGQNHELEIPIEGATFSDSNVERLWQSFHELHESQFGFANPGEVIELVNIKVIGVSQSTNVSFPNIGTATRSPGKVTDRNVRYETGWERVPVYRRKDLFASQKLDGPAVVEEDASSTILRRGQTLTVDSIGNLIIH